MLQAGRPVLGCSDLQPSLTFRLIRPLMRKVQPCTRKRNTAQGGGGNHSHVREVRCVMARDAFRHQLSAYLETGEPP